MNKDLPLQYQNNSLKLDLDQCTNKENSPILDFLDKQKKKRNIFYISFSVVAIQVQFKHAYYLIEVNEYGKKWMMRIRFSQIKKLKKQLCKNYKLQLTLQTNFVLNQLSPDNLKKRAIQIQSFFNQIGGNYMLMNTQYCLQFLQEQKSLGEILIDFTEQETFKLES